MLEQINPQFSLETQRAWLKIIIFVHIMQRPSSLEKFARLVAFFLKRKRGQPTISWINSITMAVDILSENLKYQVGGRWSWSQYFYVVVRNQYWTDGTQSYVIVRALRIELKKFIVLFLFFLQPCNPGQMHYMLAISAKGRKLQYVTWQCVIASLTRLL